jgi:regulator of sigma E protease
MGQRKSGKNRQENSEMIIIYAVLLLGILIFVHELGHFIIAKILGVKVLKFSLGFGPKLIGKTYGETEYRIAAIPLGGYVKMLGENPGEELDESEKLRAFNYQSVWKRFSIVFFGPLFNICFATVVFFFIFMIGVPVPSPDIGKVAEDSPADRAGLVTGDKVLTIDGKNVHDWNDIDAAIGKSSGEPLLFTVKRGEEHIRLSVIPLLDKDKNIFGEEIEVWTIGASQLMYAQIGDVMNNSPAEKAGLMKGDSVLEIEGNRLETWQDMTEIIHNNPEQPLGFKIQRNDDVIDLIITPEKKTVQYGGIEEQTIGLIGIKPLSRDVIKRYDLFDALSLGIKRTYDLTAFTFLTIVKLFQRVVPAKTIGGPILIVQMAGQQASKGALDFFFFMAIISINLGVLNLLPIPILDGGHLLFLGIEAVRRKPLSEQVMVFTQKIGLALILTLLVFVFYNDILRLITGKMLP